MSSLLAAASEAPAVSGGAVRIGRYGVSCRLYIDGLGPPSYLVRDIGKLGVPLLSAQQTALARKIQKYFDPKTLRFSFLQTESGPRFVVYDATGNPKFDPCSDNPAAYHVLNGADNEYLEPGETGNAYGIPGDAGLPTPGPWMPPSPMPAPPNGQPAGSDGAALRSLDARWKIVRENAAYWLVAGVTQDKRIAIVAENKQITALKTIDGQTVWQRSGFVTAASADGNRIIAKTDDGRIVGLSAQTGETLWRTTRHAAASVEFAVDGDCVIVAIDPEDYDLRSRAATILALSARTGAMLWTRRTDLAFPGTRHFSFVRTTIVAGLGAFDEPSFGEAELLDRATGASVLHVHHTRYEGAFRDELWLRSTSTDSLTGPSFFCAIAPTDEGSNRIGTLRHQPANRWRSSSRSGTSSSRAATGCIATTEVRRRASKSSTDTVFPAR